MEASASIREGGLLEPALPHCVHESCGAPFDLCGSLVGVDWEKVERFVDMRPKLAAFAEPNKPRRRMRYGFRRKRIRTEYEGDSSTGKLGHKVTFAGCLTPIHDHYASGADARLADARWCCVRCSPWRSASAQLYLRHLLCEYAAALTESSSACRPCFAVPG